MIFKKFSRSLFMSKQSKVNIQLMQNRLNAVLDSIAGNHWWKDTSGRYLGCNKATAKSIGLQSPNDIIGKTDFDMPWAKQAPDLIKNDQLVISSKIVMNFEEIAETKHGTIFLLSTKAPLYDENNNIIGVVGTSVDITELKQTQKELEIAKEKAEAESKAKSEFMMNMSHDLRTPLTGIIGMAQDMLITAQKNKASLQQPDVLMNTTANKLVMNVVDTVQRDSDMLTNAADELVQLCNEIIDTVSLESGKSIEKPEAFNIRELVSDIVELLLPAATHKGLSLSYHIDKDVPTFLSGIRVYLDRNLLNLISNAIKFTKNGFVTVQVRLAEDNVDPPFALADKVNLVISIEDSGIGIPKDKFEAVFEHFSRLHPSYQGIYKGAGLGLYTVKQYVTIMGGTVTLESELAKGSTFIMHLPFTVSDHTDRVKKTVLRERKRDTGVYHTQPTSKPILHSAISSTSTQNLVPTSAKVLIVEDNVAAAITLQKNLLYHDRVESDIAYDGLDALDKIKNHDYVLIFMDIGLPDITGIELTKTIRALTIPQATVPIVAITGHANNHKIAQEALSAGMQAVMDKPPESNELNATLKRYVFDKQSTAKITPTVVIDWAANLALFNNDEKFVKALFAKLGESFAHFKQTLADHTEKPNEEALRFELNRLAEEVSYFKLPQLQAAINHYQQVLDQNAVNNSITDDVAQALAQMIDAYLVALEEQLI